MWDSVQYSKLLLTDAWRKCRIRILERDKLVCQDCSNASYFTASFQNRKAVPVIGVPFDILRVYDTKDNIVSWCPTGYSDFHSAVQRAGVYQETVVVVYKGSVSDENPYALFRVNNTITALIEGTNSVNNSGSISKPLFTLSSLNKQGLLTWLYVRNLQVHHTYYKQGHLPWDYPDSALITLCQVCHQKRHKESPIAITDSKDNIVGYVKPDLLYNNGDDAKPVFIK